MATAAFPVMGSNEKKKMLKSEKQVRHFFIRKPILQYLSMLILEFVDL
jgi:hypothetical protein